MTKKHFIAIAAEFKNSLDNARRMDGGPLVSVGRHGEVVIHTIHGFCNVAARFNPSFDRARFLKASGINN